MDKKAEILAAHQAEMNEASSRKPLVLTPDQVHQAQVKYATLCAEYAACRGIYATYRAAGLNGIAGPFATGATVAGECVQAAGEILDILGIAHSRSGK